MKHPRDDTDTSYGLRQHNRLKHATLPPSICSLPHVMKRIGLFSMSLEEAAVEAATTNDIDLLRSVLAQIDFDEDRDDVGCDGTHIAAANGYVEIIKTIYRWWVKDSYGPIRLCKQALVNAVNGGHVEAVKTLLSNWHQIERFNSRDDDKIVERPYDFDMMEALELAVNKGDYDIVWVICDKNRIPGKVFLWAAEMII